MRDVMSLSIYRVDYSPYFSEEFQKNEIESLQEAGFNWLTEFRSVADVLITNTSTTSERLREFDLSRVKLIVHPNSGFDNFSPKFVSELDCPFVLGNSLRATAVAENIVTHLMARNQQPAQEKWNRDKSLIKRRLLKDQKVLIYGYGHIGQLVEQTLTTLMTVDVVDPYQKLNPSIKLDEYDAILLCCSLNSRNKHMIDREYLSLLKSDVTIINSARGPLIDWEALLSFLENNPKSQAFLDVFEVEPHPIEKFHLPNLHMTSHIAGVHEGLDREIIQFEKTVIEDFQKLSDANFRNQYKNLLLSGKILEGEFI